MVNDSLKSNKLIGMIQPKKTKKLMNKRYLHNIGCLGKITSFRETDDGRYLIELKGLIRFKIEKEFETNKKYRECEINFNNYLDDLNDNKEDLKFSDLKIIFEDLKIFLKKEVL